VTEIREEIREGSPADFSLPHAQAESAQRAKSITPPASVAFDAVTQGAQAFRRGMTSAVTALDRPGSLFDVRPPTLKELRGWHHECAGHYDALLLSAPRRVWAYVHLAIVMVLRGVEWITGSPIRLVVAAAVATLIWYGS
jgi:hypothetical protein